MVTHSSFSWKEHWRGPEPPPKKNLLAPLIWAGTCPWPSPTYLVNVGLIQEGEQRAAEGRGRALVVDHGHLDAYGVAAHAQADERDLDDGQEELEAQGAGTTEEMRTDGVHFRHQRQSSAQITERGCAPTRASSSCAPWSWPSGRRCFSTWAAGVGLAPSSRLKERNKEAVS